MRINMCNAITFLKKKESSNDFHFPELHTEHYYGYN